MYVIIPVLYMDVKIQHHAEKHLEANLLYRKSPTIGTLIFVLLIPSPFLSGP